MIITERFVFLHLHKSGGSFVNQCLLRFVPGARSIGHLLPRMLIPAENLDLPVLGFVRNPWSYYVSWYHFQTQRQLPNPFFRILSDGGRLGFEATIRNMLELGSSSRHLEAILAELPTSYTNRGLNLPRFALLPIRNTREGFYSFLYRYLYGDFDSKLTVERAENLRPKLLEYLLRVGHRVTAAANDFVMDSDAQNALVYEPYVDHYSDGLRDLVAEKEKLIIERHGYRFGSDA
jgi:hypothetical protein